MKKFVCGILALVFCLTAGCSGQSADQEEVVTETVETTEATEAQVSDAELAYEMVRCVFDDGGENYFGMHSDEVAKLFDGFYAEENASDIYSSDTTKLVKYAIDDPEALFFFPLDKDYDVDIDLVYNADDRLEKVMFDVHTNGGRRRLMLSTT